MLTDQVPLDSELREELNFRCQYFEAPGIFLKRCKASLDHELSGVGLGGGAAEANGCAGTALAAAVEAADAD